MKRLYHEVKRVGEVFDIDQVSFQLKELLTLISEGREIDSKKFTQISPEALSFLQEKAQFLEENELKYILLSLLTESKPENQKNIIEIFDEFICASKEETIKKINREKFEAQKFTYLNELLEKLIRRSWVWDIKSLLSFYTPPENRKIRPDILERALEIAIRRGSEWEIEYLLSFYTPPENQKIRPDILERALEIAITNDWYYVLLSFCTPPENRKIRPDILERALEIAITRGWDNGIEALFSFYTPIENRKIRPDILEKALEIAIRRGKWYDIMDLLSFYTPIENQKIRPDILERALEIAITRHTNMDIKSLLSFYTPPENRKIRPDIFKKVLEEARTLKRLEGDIKSLLSFYTPPENRKIRPDILEKTLEVAFEIAITQGLDWSIEALLSFYTPIENRKIRPDILDKVLKKAKSNDLYDVLLSFHTPPESQPKLAQTTQDKIIKSIKTIADENLRDDVSEIYIKYFKSKDSPLSLFLLSKNEDLPILISAYNLNIKPEVILNWNLTRREKETILPILMDLNKHNIKFPFPFIFYPRKEIKQTRKHNELIIDYLRTLNFIANLPQELKVNLIEDHFKKIEELIQKYNITQTTTDIPFSFLRKILNNVKELKQEAFQRLKQILQIQEEITEKEWEKFIKESKYSDQLITLAIHYSQIYQEGLLLLGKIATAMIKGTYFDLRYNLNDPITQEQLAPLLEGITEEQKKQRMLDIWRGNYYSFHLQSVEEIKKETEAAKNYDDILGHLRSQIIGDKHYESILNLISGLNAEDRQILSTVFEEALYGKTINLGKIRQILEKYQLSKEKINCFIGIIQLLRDLNLKKKPEEYLSTFDRLEKSIQNNWQQLLNTVIIETDILNYLKKQLKELIAPSEKILRKRILVSYFTDHPKTLLEIGAYPIHTCQDYRSTDTWNTRLLGYIFDTHIKALVAREIEIEEDINVEDLEKSQIEIDDNNEKITIIFQDGRKIEASVSKPVARRIVMLGKLNDQPVLLLEPIYSQGGRTSKEIEYLNKPINKLLEELRKDNVNIETTTSNDTITPQSHNPAGYYRDV